MKTEKTIIKTEAHFFDSEYSFFADSDLAINAFMMRKYSSPRKTPIDWREWSAVRMGKLQGKVVLDYGCGSGEETLYFAKLGAEVYSIDISPIGIETTKKRAKTHHVEDRVHAQVMDAMKTEFPSETFDVIHGIGILHHLDMDKAIEEVRRLLKKGGKALFLEPVNNSRLMAVLKRIIPVKKMEITEFERQFTYADIERIGKRFEECRYWDFYFLARFRKLFRSQRIVDRLKRIDCFLFRNISILRHFGSGVVIELIK